MIQRIYLRNYKSFADAEAALDPLTVIFGPNDAGKSNLLDSLDLLSELAEVDSLKKAFDPRLHRGRLIEAFRSPAGFGANGLDSFQKSDRIFLELTVDVRLQPGIVDRINAGLKAREAAANAKAPYTRVVERYLRYRLRIELHYGSGELFVVDEYLAPLTMKGEPKKSRSPFIERDDESSRFVVRIERQGHPRYYDLNRNRTLLSEISDPVYHPHVVAAKEEIRSWRSYYVEPSKVRREAGVYGADDPGRHGEDLAAFYWKLKHEHPKRFKVVCLNLHRLVPTIDRIDIRETLGNLDPYIVNEDGSEFPVRLASEGTLRLLCLLGIAVAPAAPALVAYEEPENGVHPARLDILAHILRSLAQRGRTQVILTSHSPTFLGRLRDADFVVCKRGEDSGSVLLNYSERDKLYAYTDVDKASDVAETLGGLEWGDV